VGNLPLTSKPLASFGCKATLSYLKILLTKMNIGIFGFCIYCTVTVVLVVVAEPMVTVS
jgi:hypothetical protein